MRTAVRRAPNGFMLLKNAVKRIGCSRTTLMKHVGDLDIKLMRHRGALCIRRSDADFVRDLRRSA